MTRQEQMKAVAKQMADDDIANGEADKKDRAKLVEMWLKWLKNLSESRG